jgi:hypothetical protein
MVSKEEKKEADRARMKAKRGCDKSLENNDVADSREQSQDVANSSQQSPNVADVAHAEAEADTEAIKQTSSLRSDVPRARRKQTGRSAKPQATPMSDDFGISDRVKAWAEKKGFGDLDEHFEAFRRKCRAKGYEYIDWDDALMEAIREDWAKIRRGQPQQSGGASFDGPSPAAMRRLGS